jgi:hypothetical protein
VPFPYYERLSPRNKAIYRQSAAVTDVRLPRAEALWPFVLELRAALERDDRLGVQAVANGLCRSLTEMLEIPRVAVQVLAVRPSAGWGELHGLYTQDDKDGPRIQVWMRTAHHKRVVAFRTFLRTLLHEIGHHLDYHHLKLADSFHTEGFFRRESSLFRQLVPGDEARKTRTR